MLCCAVPCYARNTGYVSVSSASLIAATDLYIAGLQSLAARDCDRSIKHVLSRQSNMCSLLVKQTSVASTWKLWVLSHGKVKHALIHLSSKVFASKLQTMGEPAGQGQACITKHIMQT